MTAFLLDSTEDIEAAIAGDVRGTDEEDLDLVERAPSPRKETEP